MTNIKNKNIRQIQHQKGVTAITMALVLALVAFLALIALRLFPIYMENFKVSSHLKQLASDSDTKNKTDKDLLDTLFKRFSIDDISNIKRENVFIERPQSGPMVIAIEYEVRTSAVGNVDMVVSFVDEVEVR